MYELIHDIIAAMRKGIYSKSYALGYIDCAKDADIITTEEYNALRESISNWPRQKLMRI